MELNPEQQKAVEHVEGPLLVLAGAGSGKTRVVTERVAHLLKLGVPAGEILAVTFTNKAAEEMRKRILHATHQTVLTCTFHSLCARILRSEIDRLGYGKDFGIFDEEDSEKVLRECGIEKGEVKSFKGRISDVKNQLISPQVLEKEDPGLFGVYGMYQSKLKLYNALDFDDLLFLTVDLFKQFPEVLEGYQRRWQFILIDEYQDTNMAQYTLIRLLSARHQNVFAVGDPDQSIYSWRGANVGNILNFEKDFPTARVIPLEQNYRSHTHILDAANALIRNNQSRYEKNLWSALGAGEKISLFIGETDRDEVLYVLKRLYKLHSDMGIALNECVIFYRTNSQSRIFEDALLREKIPYQIIGGLSFYQRKEIKDILALLRMVVSGTDDVAFARTINLPKRGLGESALEKIRALGPDLIGSCGRIIRGEADVKLSSKQMQGLSDYVRVIETLREMHRIQRPLPEILTEAMERSRYIDYLKEDMESYTERRENVEELVSKAAESDGGLIAFLEELSLKSSHDESGKHVDSVKLMTLHNSKGLEFRVVFMVGMEEDLFPHVNSREEPALLEEERRLCYVGMTRARDHLHLSAARHRLLWGTHRTMRPSRFLEEIPEEHIDHAGVARSESVGEFEVGEEVFHRDFGVGIIQKGYHTSLGMTYDVFFPKTNGIRSLVARFAKLMKRP